MKRVYEQFVDHKSERYTFIELADQLSIRASKQNEEYLVMEDAVRWLRCLKLAKYDNKGKNSQFRFWSAGKEISKENF